MQEDPQSGAPQKAAGTRPKILDSASQVTRVFGAIRKNVGASSGWFRNKFRMHLSVGQTWDLSIPMYNFLIDPLYSSIDPRIYSYLDPSMG